MSLVRSLALVALAACTTPAPVTPAPQPVKLVVLIVVDQWPMALFDRDRHLFTGGFARLIREGAVATAELPYANTFTAPGHATIGTGVLPHVHGIVGNEWYRRAEGRSRSAEYDPEAPPLSLGAADGDDRADGASGNALLVDGIADHLHGHGKSVAIAFKPRAAVLMLGKHPDLAVWYEPSAGGMTTSRAYAATPPAWLVSLAKTKPVSRFFKQTWTPRDAGLLARETGIADDAPGEANEHDMGRVFPHSLATANGPQRAIAMTPFADEVTLDTAVAAIDGMQLGSTTTDVLAISFAAHDFAGHAWGPDSWEELDLTLRLDDALGKFFATLDQRYGARGWAAVVTSDHGATPIPERGGIAGARRIKPAEVLAAIGPSALSFVSQNVYLAQGADPDAAVAAAAKVPNIARAIRTDRACPDDPVICNGFVPDRSGELIVVPVRGSIVSDYPSGTHHDAPFEDTRFVPVLARGPGIAPGPRQAGLLTQVAPLVEKLLGLPARGALFFH